MPKKEVTFIFDYAAHIHRVWIGETPFLRLGGIDFSLLAPVLLASKSLAVDFGSLYLLDGCIEYAWIFHTLVRSIIDHKSSPLPWSVTTLTLSGDFSLYYHASTVTRLAFFESVSQFIFLPPATFDLFQKLAVKAGCDKPFHYELPAASIMEKFPWTSLKSPQAVTLVLPHITGLVWRDVHVHLLNVAAPMQVNSADHWVHHIRNSDDKNNEVLSQLMFVLR